MIPKTPNDVGVKPQNRQAGDLSPAFSTGNSISYTTTGNSGSNDQYAGLPIFQNPIIGNVDTTSTHEGDLGGTASKI